MTKTFKLKKGEVLFEDDKIIISDKATIQKYMRLIISLIWILAGIKSVLRPGQSDDMFMRSLWIFIATLNIIVFVVTILRSTKSVILYEDVKFIQVKQRFNNKFLDIRLKNNRLRRVNQIEDTEELEEYIETYYGGLTTK
jgi:hypothetical protein